jgi:hypothetical protein
MKNKNRNLKYVKLNQSILKLVIFIDVFFVNNKDFSSQIEYIICLVDAINIVNILHWSFIKCKRVIRSVLVVELYAIIDDFDVHSVLKAILRKMFNVLILLILVTDSKCLYDCLIRLSITVEKRLMIDVMTLRQSYERREIIKSKWISDDDNSANSMIKIKSFTTLKIVIDINRVRLNSMKWVERTN